MLEVVDRVDRDIEDQVKSALERGDTNLALEVLMEAYGNAVYRYCYRMMRNADDAEDVRQITFLQAFKDCRAFQGKSSIRAWLFGITYHRCIDALKTRRRKIDVCDPIDEIEDPVDLAPGPADEAHSRQRRTRLGECLDELDPDVRSAVLLRYQQGFSYPEMTALSGVHPATLQARVTRAMPLLRQCLERKGIQG
jgi:RNA polymerase sigma-70 factor (ECF subfamily)